MIKDEEIKEIETSQSAENSKAELQKEVRKTRFFLDNPDIRKTFGQLKISSAAKFDFSIPTIMANYESYHKDSMPGGSLAFFSKDFTKTLEAKDQEVEAKDQQAIAKNLPIPLSIELILNRFEQVKKKLTKFYIQVKSQIDNAKSSLKNAIITTQQKGTSQAAHEHLESIKTMAPKIMGKEKELIPIQKDLQLVLSLEKSFIDFIKLDGEIVNKHLISLQEKENEIATFFNSYENFMGENKDSLNAIEFYRWKTNLKKVMANPEDQNYPEKLLKIIKTCNSNSAALTNMINPLQTIQQGFMVEISKFADYEQQIAPVFVQEYIKSISEEIVQRAEACNKTLTNIKNLIQLFENVKNDLQARYSEAVNSSKNEPMESESTFRY